MPIWLRKFTFQKLKQYYDKQQEEYSKANKSSKSKVPKIARPNIKPAFRAKVPKK